MSITILTKMLMQHYLGFVIMDLSLMISERLKKFL